MPVYIQPNSYIYSPPKFISKISDCLNLLASKANNYRRWMDSYDLTIRPHSRSGANFKDDTIDLAQNTFFTSKHWLSSVLIHETIHFWQYRNGHYDDITFIEREQRANHHQLIVLKLIGGSEKEIAHLASQKGTHGDLDGDGDYDWDDYNLRNW